MKKPPLAPKPKLPTTTKPSPPPIAPKPGLLSPSSLVSQPSPATLKRTKPAVAPKPCIPKSTTSSPTVSPPPAKPSGHLILSPEQDDALNDSLTLLNSKNGILSETVSQESEYIIPTCSCGLEDNFQCQHLENGNATETGSWHKALLKNGSAATPEKSENQQDGEADETGEGGGIIKKHKDKPQRQRHVDRASVCKEARRGDESEPVKHQDSVSSETWSLAKADEVQTNCNQACDVAGSIISPVTLHESTAETDQVENDEAASAGLHSQVPAPPSKPLPVPHPRKLKKPVLVRQDGVEGGAKDQVEEQKGLEEVGGPTPDSSDDALPQNDSTPVDDDDDPGAAPVPPPRQTSLSPRLHRTVHLFPTLNKNTSHSLNLLSQAESSSCTQEGDAHWVDAEDEEDGYGDFERYPITHSLPKQLKLGHPPLVYARKAFSAEDQPSLRAPPVKPQRHSLPAPPPPSVCPPAPPHGHMRELPAPPQEKTAWRFTRPCMTFFSRQMPTRSSVPPKGRAPLLGGKQRAQSFSAADLATRGDSPKRSLSFRKLMELRLSVKLLPKLLAKGGQSLDCTSTDSHRGGKSLERPNSCIGEADICGDGSVEYENVPLYEEIPEYMNLPFHSARLGWSHDPDGADSDIYEVQDPYQRCQDNEYERYSVLFVPALCGYSQYDKMVFVTFPSRFVVIHLRDVTNIAQSTEMFEQILNRK